ncbi:MAG: hypothetical protein QM536_06165 [Chitinophagaceae bacterium]|nr:hypothetical protein [Chitinophagaceae bacterium]
MDRKRKIIFRFTIGFFCVLSVHFVNAQGGFKWPEDPEKRSAAEERNAVYNDYVKQGQFENAVEPHAWLLENTPDLNKAIYINGAKIYENLAEKETNAQKKIEYQEKALDMYDRRIKYFNEEGKVLNRQAITAYKYWKDNTGKYIQLIEILEKVFRLNKSETLEENIVAFMDIIRRYKQSGGSITDEKIFAYYFELDEVLEAKLNAEKNTDNIKKIEKISGTVDDILTSIVKVNCEFIEKNFGDKLKTDPNNVQSAKKLFKILVAGKCNESPLYLISLKVIQKAQPSVDFALIIAKELATENKITEALEYYNSALSLANEKNDKQKVSDIYLDLAKVYKKKEDKVTAREYARKSISAHTSNETEAYTFIGNLYLSSYNECREGKSKVKDRAVFIAAYEMYKKAGNKEEMQKTRKQFPSVEEIFNEGLKEKDMVSIGCWIDTQILIQVRDDE